MECGSMCHDANLEKKISIRFCYRSRLGLATHLNFAFATDFNFAFATEWLQARLAGVQKTDRLRNLQYAVATCSTSQGIS